MLFRVKTPGGQTVKVNAEGTLTELRAAISAATGISSAPRVSLDGKTEVTGGDSLYDLGFRSGDLLHLLDATASGTQPQAAGPRGEVVCKYYRLGSCVLGERCAFLHASVRGVQRQAPRSAADAGGATVAPAPRTAPR
jgi:glutaredoxin